ncbi:MAG: IPT/TIG domain-containing protein [Candidatus Dormibacteraeota bacterium]|nr:IPT/TIG domain-containing protein [Candidatus Dormibacteraeota bacterium]
MDQTDSQHYGVPGSTVVTVSGANFTSPNCTPSVTIGPPDKAATVDAQHLTVDNTGASLTFTLPNGPGGAVTVLLTDSLGNSASSNSNFHFYALPAATVSTTAPIENGAVAVAGANFTFGGTVTTPPSVAVCDGSAPSMKPPVTLQSDTSLTFPAPAVYCSGPVQLTFRAPYDSNAATAGTDTPVTMPVEAGSIDIAGHVTSISPAGAVLPGTRVTVSGSGFGPAGVASVGGAPAASIWSDSSVVLTVPEAANSGTLLLTRGADARIVAAARLAVQSLVRTVSPASGAVGDVVTIAGTGFGTATGLVQFGGVIAAVEFWTPGQIIVTVPDGAVSGQLRVLPALNAAGASVAFTVVPRILSMTPNTGGPGTLVALRGTSFGFRAGRITIGGRLGSVTIWSDHAVIFAMPAALAPGPVTLTLATAGGGVATASTRFIVTSASVPPGSGRSAGIIEPNLNGTPKVTTKPFTFSPPPQDGPVAVGVNIPLSAPPGSDIPYTVTVAAFGAPVAQVKVTVAIALEPGTDAALTAGTTTTDAKGQVHGFIHLSKTPGQTLILASTGPYRNEVEISSLNVNAAAIGGAPFFVNSLGDSGGVVVLAALLALIILALAMSRGRVYSPVGFSPDLGAPRRPLMDSLVTVIAARRTATLGRLRNQPWQRILRGWWDHNRDVVWRVGGFALGIVLILMYLLASISTLTALPLALGFGSSAVVPEGTVYYIASILVSLALTAIAVRYIYYYRCWVVSRHFFTHPTVPDPAVLAGRVIPNMKVQVTTKGGALPVVERSLIELERIISRHDWLRSKVTAEVITEVAEEAESIEQRFAGSALRVSGVLLPADYATPNGTLLKARALHYMVEKRRTGWNRLQGRTFIVHFDEETLVTESHLLVLVDYLSDNPRPVSQGPIVYPLEWKKIPWICRALESTRPFGCSECARVMENPPPPHLHGSNLVVDQEAEDSIGWDFGTLDGQPFIAEDLLFGLRAYSVIGREAFGWHGATMMEQPPLSLHWAVQQRLRWVTGALQGLRVMNRRTEYQGITKREQRRLFSSIAYRIATYSLGFPVGFAGLYFIIHPAETQTQWASLFGLWRALIIFSAVCWVMSYQIGIARNLRYQVTTRRQRILHSVAILVMTPIAGLCETVGPFVALLRWLFGARRASWTPTPKLSDRRPKPAEVTVIPADDHGGQEIITAPQSPA